MIKYSSLLPFFLSIFLGCFAPKTVVKPHPLGIIKSTRMRVSIPYDTTFITYKLDSLNGRYYYKYATHDSHFDMDTMELNYFKFSKPNRKNYRNGDLNCVGSLVNGYKNGLWTEYLSYYKEDYIYDTLKYITEYYKEGVLHGKRTVWDCKRQKVNETVFNNGTGYYKDYYQDGNLFREGQLVLGRMVGEWKFYDPIGNLRQSTEFQNKPFYPYDNDLYTDTFKIERWHELPAMLTKSSNPCIHLWVQQGKVYFVPLNVNILPVLENATIDYISVPEHFTIRDAYNNKLTFPVKIDDDKLLKLNIMIETETLASYHDDIQTFARNSSDIGIALVKNNKKYYYKIPFQFLIEMRETKYPLLRD